MKKTIVILFVIISSSVISKDIKELELEPKKFRGIEWGENISDFTENPEKSEISSPFAYTTDPEKKCFVFQESKNGVDAYIKKNEKLKIGLATVIRILYMQYTEKFFAVRIDAKGIQNFNFIKKNIRKCLW